MTFVLLSASGYRSGREDRQSFVTILHFQIEFGLRFVECLKNAAAQRKKNMTHHPQTGSVSVDNCLRPFTYVNILRIRYLAVNVLPKLF